MADEGMMNTVRTGLGLLPLQMLLAQSNVISSSSSLGFHLLNDSSRFIFSYPYCGSSLQSQSKEDFWKPSIPVLVHFSVEKDEAQRSAATCLILDICIELGHCILTKIFCSAHVLPKSCSCRCERLRAAAHISPPSSS